MESWNGSGWKDLKVYPVPGEGTSSIAWGAPSPVLSWDPSQVGAGAQNVEELLHAGVFEV